MDSYPSLKEQSLKLSGGSDGALDPCPAVTCAWPQYLNVIVLGSIYDIAYFYIFLIEVIKTMALLKIDPLYRLQSHSQYVYYW